MKWYVQIEHETYDNNDPQRELTRLTSTPRPIGDKMRFAYRVRPILVGGTNVVIKVRPARRDELPAPKLIDGRWIRATPPTRSQPLRKQA